VFYEGLRPIRCRKIRYFSEKRFRKRLLPAPRVPVPSGRGPPVGAIPSTENQRASPPSDEVRAGESSSASPLPKKEEVVIRDATVEDVERIESLTLEDFAADFSKVQVPDHDGPLSDGEMTGLVDTFLSSLERA
jgi:type IV secretion system protein VirD4